MYSEYEPAPEGIVHRFARRSAIENALKRVWSCHCFTDVCPRTGMRQNMIVDQHSFYRAPQLPVQAAPGELELWASLLPAAVERARQTYAHSTGCLYTKHGSSGRTLCSCGKGKDLPPAFVKLIKPSDEIGREHGVVVHSLFHRAALSPLFVPSEKHSALPVQNGGSAAAGGDLMKCAKCGKGGKLMQCARCHKVAYCSKECQRQHWKSHKPACG